MSGAEPSDGELITAYRESGDEALRSRLVERYSGLAASIARRFEHRGVPLDDLVQVAQIGVINAVDRFDPERGAAFATYATPTVLGEIKRHFRDKTWAVRVPRGMKDLHIRVAPALAELRQTLGRSPTILEIAEHLGTSEEELLEAMEAGAAYQPDSIDAASQDGDHPGLGEVASRSDAGDESLDARVTVRSLMSQLPDRERTVVFLRYFEDLTQAEIAERVGVSQVHVSRILRQALDRLRQRA